MIKRLRLKFICINMAIVTVILCAIFGLVLHFMSLAMEQESTELMHALALTPYQPGAPGKWNPGAQLPHFILQRTSDGDWLVSGSGNYDLTDTDMLSELIRLTADEKSGVLKEYGLRFLWVTTPVSQCVVFADMSREASIITDLMETCLVIGAISFVVFLIISILLAHWAVKPVATAWEQQRQFVADASHELKTPLTVILSNAQMLSDSDEDPELREKLTANILTVSQQMKDLVTKLLNSARVDKGISTPDFSVLDLSDAVSAATLPIDSIFYEQEKELESLIRDDIHVSGSRPHLIQVVDILLDNAQKYSADGSCTQVTLKRINAKHCLLTVASQGAPMNTKELKNIFKRFYRADDSRHRNGSYGLGLSIAESIVKAHKGKIWAESKNGINTFFVQLPALPEKAQ